MNKKLEIAHKRFSEYEFIEFDTYKESIIGCLFESIGIEDRVIQSR